MDEPDWAAAALRRVGRRRVVGHIAEGHLIIGQIVRALAAGRPLPVQAYRTVEQGAANAAKPAASPRGPGTDSGTLHANTERMARFIEGLSDEDLRREIVGFPGLTLADEIERGLLGHLRGHAGAVRLALMEGRASTPGTPS